MVAVTLVLTSALLWLRHEIAPAADDLARTLTGLAHPPRPADASLGRLDPVVAGPAGSGGFTFLQENALGPAAYDPCRPIHVVVHEEVNVPGSDALLSSALSRISQASGLRFVVDGATDEPASRDRPATDRARYGNRWSPVLVAWTTPERVPALAGDVAGVGGSTAVPVASGRLVNVTGIAYLDGVTAAADVSRPGGAAAWRSVVMHELGHVVGLGHVTDRSQLMAESGSGLSDLGPGDLRGLAVLGAQPCTREL